MGKTQLFWTRCNRVSFLVLLARARKSIAVEVDHEQEHRITRGRRALAAALVQPRLATIGHVAVNDPAFRRFIERGDERAMVLRLPTACRLPFGERTQIGNDAAIAQSAARSFGEHVWRRIWNWPWIRILWTGRLADDRNVVKASDFAARHSSSRLPAPTIERLDGSGLPTPVTVRAMELFWWGVTLVLMAVGLIGTVSADFSRANRHPRRGRSCTGFMLGPARRIGEWSIALLLR